MSRSYYSLNQYYQDTFGEKVYKLSVNAGMTCPNRDGTLGSTGCIFCSGGSGDFAEGALQLDGIHYIPGQITAALNRARARISGKTDCRKFIAYFQAYTNTYAPLDYLEGIFTEAAALDDIVGISVATRCDCVGDDVIALLLSINRIKPVFVELGCQSSHNTTLELLKTGYTFEQFTDAVARLHAAGLNVTAHLILSLLGETEEMMLESVRRVCTLPIDGIKLQMLHILEGTPLASIYEANPYHLLSMDEYIKIIGECIDIIPRNIVIHRLTGDGPRRLLIAPDWTTDKKRVLNAINRLLLCT